MNAIYYDRNFEYKFSEDDVVNPENFIPEGDFNPHNVHPFILLDAGFVVAVCFADCLQDAIDEAVDAVMLDRFLVTTEELRDYETGVVSEEGYPEYDGRIANLGNAGEPFDIESLDVCEVPNNKWVRKYWTIEQLDQQIESAADSLCMAGRIGLTQAGFDKELTKLTDSLREKFGRKEDSL